MNKPLPSCEVSMPLAAGLFAIYFRRFCVHSCARVYMEKTAISCADAIQRNLLVPRADRFYLSGVFERRTNVARSVGLLPAEQKGGRANTSNLPKSLRHEYLLPACGTSLRHLGWDVGFAGQLERITTNA